LDEMKCTQCAALSYSAAARTLVERGYRCPQCGGEVALAQETRPPVGVTAESEGAAEESPGAAELRETRERARRFERSD
jgi:DNA-directed RNA polymerase subunit RPC12/RpoP